MEWLRPLDAARELGVSYPTLKQWIYRGQVRSVRTPGGHHRIPRSEIERLSGARGDAKRSAGRKTPRRGISGRNKLEGRILEVRYEGLLAEVRLDIGGQVVTSIITRRSAEEMGLRSGIRAAALIKATEVMILRD